MLDALLRGATWFDGPGWDDAGHQPLGVQRPP